MKEHARAIDMTTGESITFVFVGEQYTMMAMTRDGDQMHVTFEKTYGTPKLRMISEHGPELQNLPKPTQL